MHQSTIKEGYLRVTEILSPFSGLSNVPEHILENAKERGTAVHQAISAIENGIGQDGHNDSIAGYLSSYNQWACGKVFMQVPDRFYDDSLMITGEIDAMYETEDGIIIVDYKTPMKESKTWPLQATAYSYLARQNGYYVLGVQFVKLDASGKEPIIYEYKENMDLFLSILETYRYFYGKKEKKLKTKKTPLSEEGKINKGNLYE